MTSPYNGFFRVVRDPSSNFDTDRATKTESDLPAGWWILPSCLLGMVGWVLIIYMIWKWVR
jgi:hypothetical protein